MATRPEELDSQSSHPQHKIYELINFSPLYSGSMVSTLAVAILISYNYVPVFLDTP